MSLIPSHEDLLIYLRSSIPNLVSQIHKRGRDYENSIDSSHSTIDHEIQKELVEEYEKMLEENVVKKNDSMQKNKDI